MKGGKPKNPHLSLIDGNPGKRPIPEMPPVPKLTERGAPAWLREALGSQNEHRHAEAQIALEFWTQHVPLLIEADMMSAVDRETFASGCRLWAVFRSPDPKFKLGARIAAHTSAMRIFNAFGLTPGERVRLGKRPKKESPGTKWGAAL